MEKRYSQISDSKMRKRSSTNSRNKRTNFIGDFEQAIDMRRPFKKIYKEFKWLNAFAIINYVAMQEILKDFENLFFMSPQCQVLKANLECIVNNTDIKHNHHLF